MLANADLPTTGASEDARNVSAGGMRMRASRERRRAGMRSLTIEVRDSEIDQLVALGYMHSADRHDKNQVAQALYRFFDRALGAAHQQVGQADE